MGQKFYILWPINSFFVRIGGQVGIHLRVRLFWVKMISGNHFHPFPHVWLQRKIQYFGNCIPVNQNLPLWPGNEFTLSFSLQFISRSLSTHNNTERKREEKHKTNAHTERTSSDPQTRAPIHSDPRTNVPIHEPTILSHIWIVFNLLLLFFYYYYYVISIVRDILIH